MKKHLPLIVISIFIYSFAYSQLCTGTTRIVWKDDFGSGASIVGPASAAINSAYVEQNYGVGPGSYSLVNYFNYQTCCWYKIPEDHTPGDTGGYFLVVDGGGASNFYSSKVTNICPNTTYTFSAWAMNMDLPSFPSNTSFIFKITDLSGNTIAQINTPIIPAQPVAPAWENFGITFNSGNNNALILNVEFNSNGYNDFGFDDFEFGVCGPSLSIANTINSCQTKVDLQTTIVNNYPSSTYQWYKQDASGTWISLPGAININYTDSTLLTSNWYKFRVTDGASMCSYVEDSINVTTNPSPPALITITGDTNICKGSNATFTANGADSYTWSTGQTGNSISVKPTSATTYIVNGIKSGCPASPKSFTVNMIAPVITSIDKIITCGTSYLGHSTSGIYIDTLASVGRCDSIETVNLTVNGGIPNFEMPNAFTPNHDGVNDCYGIKYPGSITQLTFFIYNRWGQEVFSTTDPTACWDGTFQGQRSDPGNYVYYIKATNSCGTFEKKGNVILIR